MSEWQVAHETLSRLARERAAADAVEGHWLLRARRTQAHVHLGFGSFVSYVEQLFGYTPRSILEKLRVAEALEQLPASRAALEQGQLGWSAVRELSRVAVRETEGIWLQAARGKTVRQLEQLVAGKRPGDAPSDKPDPRAVRYVLRFEVTAETYALFREALRELRRRSSSCFDDDAALLEMARCILGGPTPCGPAPGREEGRSSYQIALSVCPECGVGRQPANGQLIPVAPEILDMAECDAQRLPLEETAQAGGTDEHRPAHDAALASRVDVSGIAAEHRPLQDRDASAEAQGVGITGERRLGLEACSATDAQAGGADEHHHTHDAALAAGREVRGNADEHRSPADAEVVSIAGEHRRAPQLIPAAEADVSSIANGHAPTQERRSPARAHVGAAGAGRAPAHGGKRARQDIPPALRRAVLRRDERRCRVAGCRNATFLDLHHIQPRSEGGSHSADNLVTLCSAHHRALHRGELRGAGDARDFRVLPGELHVSVDGAAHPSAAPNSLDVSTQVASGLCQLGFRPAQVHAVMAELRQQSELASAAPQHWIREALRRLHPASARSR
jgi:hypothetical protein